MPPPEKRGNVDGGSGGTDGSIGAGGTGGSTGTGGGRPDAVPDAREAATSDGALPCIIDGGDASGDCCPDDPNKTQPGICGCGVPDTDGDGIADCLDLCPTDGLKTAPGACGCGLPDVDTDLDGTLDCNDGCPRPSFWHVAGNVRKRRHGAD